MTRKQITRTIIFYALEFGEMAIHILGWCAIILLLVGIFGRH